MATPLGAVINRNRYGEKPVVPPFPTLDTGAEQQAATAGNIAATPGLQTLASSANAFSLSEAQKMLESWLPGFGASFKQAGADAGSLTRGIIPQDVQNSVWNSSAARSLYGGYGGSGLGRNLTARDFGTTSLGLQQTGLSRLTGLGQFSNALTPRFDYTSMFITPTQKLSFDFQQNEATWNRNWLAAQIQAAPSPAQQALAAGIDEDLNMLRQFAFSVGGMALGGGMGGGMMGGGGGGGGGGSGSSGPNPSQFGGGWGRFTDTAPGGYGDPGGWPQNNNWSSGGSITGF